MSDLYEKDHEMEDSPVDDTQQNAEQVQSQEHIMEIVEGRLSSFSISTVVAYVLLCFVRISNLDPR